MSCRFCAHWQARSASARLYEENGAGNCTLYPVWTETKRSHFCGQLTLKTSDGHTMEDFRDGMGEYWRLYQAEREKRISAEKNAKLLRGKIRDLKAVR